MMRHSMYGRRSHALTAVFSGLGVALLTAACASSPPAPEVAMSAARQAIAVADQAHIADTSSPELTEARSKLAAADAAIQTQHMLEAERLAQESRVDAELAFAQSVASNNQAVNDEMLRSTDTLSQEIKRNAGATP